MTPERWRQLKDLYAEASELDGPEREKLLASASDPELANLLRRLLEAGRSEGFLDHPLPLLDDTCPPPPAAHAFSPGDCLCDRFQVVRFIARGGMGEVYEAYDTELREPVALKTVRLSTGHDVRFTELFRREVRRARAITSQHVCRVHDLFTHRAVSEPPVLFLSMRLLDGETLAARIQRESKLRLGDALPLLRQIAEGLDAAHRERIVHGDLKSANVMLTRDGDGSLSACITDFGLARRIPRAEDDTESVSDALARGGTPAWMAPEQVEGQPPGLEADIYALGLVAYEMVTGRLPFDGKTPEAIARRRLTEPPLPARRFTPELPAAWDSTLLRCLDRDPAKRFSSAVSFVAALESGPAAMPRLRPRWPAVLTAVVMAVAAAVEWQPIQHWIAPSHHDALDRSVAVLPFQRIGPTPEYFSDGFTEELMHALGQLRGLRVLGPESSFQFKSSNQSPHDIGRKLGVRYLLTGSVRRLDREIRVIARLIDTVDGAQIWSRDVTRNERDVLLIRDDITRMLSGELKIDLVGTQLAAQSIDATSLSAHDLYWTGRLYFRQRTDEAVRASLGYFRQAVARDPSFALGYCGLADALFVAAERALLPPDQAMIEARQAAHQAIQLDGRLPEAWVSLAQVTSIYDRNLDEAERYFRRALELDPKLASAWQWYAYQLAKQRRFPEAVQAGEAAVSADPLSMSANINLADMYFYAGLDDRTVQQCRKLMQMDPNLFFDHLLTAVVFARKGLMGEALHEMEAVPAARKDHPWTLRVWVELYAIAGLRDQAGQALERLLAQYRQGGVQPSYVATAYAALGDKDRAFEWLESAVDQRDASASFASSYPAFDSIRSDPRYAPLMARLGIKAQTASGSSPVH
jgi:serine/threonine-protein kinase